MVMSSVGSLDANGLSSSVLKLEKAEAGEGGQRRDEQEPDGDKLCEENPAAGRLLLCLTKVITGKKKPTDK